MNGWPSRARPGHGKSTLLQILGGLDRPSGGIVDFDGRDLAQLLVTHDSTVARRAQRIGVMKKGLLSFRPLPHPAQIVPEGQ